MKTKKQKKRTQQQSSQTSKYKLEQLKSHKIKFQFNKDSIACFIGQKSGIKKDVDLTQKYNKKVKKLTVEQECQLSKLKRPISIGKKIKKTQCQEILYEPLNQILSEIENKGIQHKWDEMQDQNMIQQDIFQECQGSLIWSVFSVNSSFQKSYGSTMDIYPTTNNHYYPQPNNYHQPYYYDYQSKVYDQQNSYILTFQHIINDNRTTIMIRNIPNKYTIKELSQEIDSELPNSYDFLYLPCDIKNQCNVGYGFINFLNVECLLQFYYIFQGKRWQKFRSQKICNLTYARLQGLNSLIEHFANSKVLNQKDKRYRPIIKEYQNIGHLLKSQQLI